MFEIEAISKLSVWLNSKHCEFFDLIKRQPKKFYSFFGLIIFGWNILVWGNSLPYGLLSLGYDKCDSETRIQGEPSGKIGSRAFQIGFGELVLFTSSPGGISKIEDIAGGHPLEPFFRVFGFFKSTDYDRDYHGDNAIVAFCGYGAVFGTIRYRELNDR